ncbi:MAG: hypothetical protein L6R37_004787 [Teloschistes peruensis]|nr:MAG: hypothetical protein L6R37_004787 [Teloschistes peruensis]
MDTPTLQPLPPSISIDKSKHQKEEKKEKRKTYISTSPIPPKAPPPSRSNYTISAPTQVRPQHPPTLPPHRTTPFWDAIVELNARLYHAVHNPTPTKSTGRPGTSHAKPAPSTTSFHFEDIDDLEQMLCAWVRMSGCSHVGAKAGAVGAVEETVERLRGVKEQAEGVAWGA